MAEYENFIGTSIKNFGEDWREHNGAETQEFIERMLKGLQQRIETLAGSKVGEILFSTDADGEVSVRFFADVEAREQWELNPTEYATNVLGSMNFRVSDAGTDDYTLSTRVTRMPVSPVIRGAENILTFSYSSYYGGDATNLDTESGTATISINNTEITALRQTLRPGNEYSVDLGPYLTAENNAVQLTVANAHGKRRVFNMSIQTVEISIGFDDSFDESLVRDAGWPLRVRCNGVEAMLHLLIDGTERGTASVHNSSVDFTIDADGSLDAGAHSVAVYAANASFNLQSETITTSFIKRGLASPTVCIGRMADVSAKQHATATIPYYLYYPSAAAGQNVLVTARVLSDDGSVLRQGIAQTVTIREGGISGMQQLRLALSEQTYLTAGTITVELSCGGATATHKIAVLDPGVNLSPAPECKIHLSAAGRTNADSDAENWVSTYNGVTTCRVVRSKGFRLTESCGFHNDAYVIPAGKSITIEGSKPFERDFGANAASPSDRTGKTIEFEVATRNCTNASAKIIECLDDGIGFVVRANGMTLYTKAGSISTVWSDETRIRFGIVVEGTTRHCVNKTVDGTTELDANLAYIYVNGVPVRLLSYGRASWKQPSPRDIVIGSADCAVEFHVARIYDKPLSRAQMIANYAYDTPDPEEKIAIARRNDVLDSYGDVSFPKVLEALPDTPYKIWEIERMPTGKKDWQKASTEFVNPRWTPDESDLAVASFKCLDHDIALDGTSSLSYPDPYKNWADKYNGKWTVTVGDKVVTITDYSITEGIVGGETEFVDKVNFASSEGIFNILATNAFQNILLKVADQYPSILTPMQAAQQAAGEEITFRQSLSGFPETGWLRTYENGVPKIRFLSLFNFVNNKYSGTPYGATRANGAELWEVEDNINFYMKACAPGEWKDGQWSDLLSTLYYSRFPKKDASGNDTGKASSPEGVDAANAQSRHLRAFHNFIQSCNPSVAERYRMRNGGDYEPLPEPVTYGTTTFRYDSPEYRIARFRAEAEKWLDKPSAMFYFIFFMGMLGVDSFDKNMTVALTKDTSNG